MGEDSETTKTSVATRLSGDTLDELETYCEEQDVSKAWAIRHFTKEGLSRAKVQGEYGVDRMSVTENVQTIGNLLAIVLALALGLSYLGVV